MSLKEPCVYLWQFKDSYPLSLTTTLENLYEIYLDKSYHVSTFIAPQCSYCVLPLTYKI